MDAVPLRVKRELARSGVLSFHDVSGTDTTSTDFASFMSGVSGGGYRSPAGQIALRRKNCGATPFDVYVKPSSQCSPPTAKIDGSPHFKGIAVDFAVNAQGVKQGTTAHRWLVKNAGTFDFVGKPEEPWHWEYRPKRPTG